MPPPLPPRAPYMCSPGAKHCHVLIGNTLWLHLLSSISCLEVQWYTMNTIKFQCPEHHTRFKNVLSSSGEIQNLVKVMLHDHLVNFGIQCQIWNQWLYMHHWSGLRVFAQHGCSEHIPKHMDLYHGLSMEGIYMKSMAWIQSQFQTWNHHSWWLKLDSNRQDLAGDSLGLLADWWSYLFLLQVWVDSSEYWLLLKPENFVQPIWWFMSLHELNFHLFGFQHGKTGARSSLVNLVQAMVKATFII